MQARRSDFIGQFEAAYRTPPAAAAKVLPMTNWDPMRDPRRQANPSVSSVPLPEKTNKGDPTFGGSFQSVFDLRTIGFWLKLLLGNPTVGKAVTTQPVDITGVSVNYAQADCAAGNGTLTYTAAGTTVTWTPNAGAAGAPVNIGAGGNFLVPGDVANSGVSISVTASALPVGNEADAAISVHAALKAHAFPFDLADRPSALIERREHDIAKFYRYLGVKLAELNWDILANDQNLSGRVIPAVDVQPVPGVTFDANPTSYGAIVRACGGGGRFWPGSGAGLGKVIGATIGYDNQMTPEKDGSSAQDGYGCVQQGDILVRGNMRAVFEGDGAYQLALDGTSTRLRTQSTSPVGADTFGVHADFPGVELVERLPPRNGKSGLVAELAWMAHANLTAPVVWLVNDVAAY